MRSKVFTIFMCLVIVGIAVLLIATSCKNNSFDQANYIVKVYEVEKGDSLWLLGMHFKDENDNVQNWIEAVKDLNRMTSAGLTVGDCIYVYVAK